mgnify:CR=1 FL=1
MAVYFVPLYTTEAPSAYAVQLVKAGSPVQEPEPVVAVAGAPRRLCLVTTSN